jgi:hypothetical protein
VQTVVIMVAMVTMEILAVVTMVTVVTMEILAVVNMVTAGDGVTTIRIVIGGMASITLTVTGY